MSKVVALLGDRRAPIWFGSLELLLVAQQAPAE
jgi:hypothetical protein